MLETQLQKYKVLSGTRLQFWFLYVAFVTTSILSLHHRTRDCP